MELLSAPTCEKGVKPHGRNPNGTALQGARAR